MLVVVRVTVAQVLEPDAAFKTTEVGLGVMVPPPGFELDPALEPQVTIIKRGTDTVEEYRVAGKLYMIKITPAYGPGYYLIDEKGDGRFARQDSSDSGIRPPMWVIQSW